METKEEKKPLEDTPVEENPTKVEETSKKVEEKPSVEEINKNLISEIKEIRKERTEAKEALKALEVKNATPETPETPTDDDLIAKKVKEILIQEGKVKAGSNKDEAFKKFVTDNKHFSEENDPTGLKRDALEKKLARFNTEGLSTQEEFYSVIEDANNLLGGDTKSKTSEVVNPYSATPAVETTPTVVEDTELTKKENDAIQRLGWTKEKLLKVKDEKPELYDSLFG